MIKSMKGFIYTLCISLWGAVAMATDIPMPDFGHESLPTQKASYAQLRTYRWNVHVGYGLKANHAAYDYNLLEADMQLEYYLHPQHALTLSLMVSGGKHDNDRWVNCNGERVAFSDNYGSFMLSLMGGYHYSQPITSKISLELGAKGGVTLQMLSVDQGRDWSDDYEYVYDEDEHSWNKKRVNKENRHGTDVGLGYSAYADIIYKITPATALHLGYAFRGTTTRPKARPRYPEDALPMRVDPMRWHVIRIGISCEY